LTLTRSFLIRAVWIAVCCLVPTAGAGLLAQEQEVEPKPVEVVSPEVEQTLWMRGREILHNGDPLDLVGLEEGDNGFRHRTPILEQSDRAVAMVDFDENYRRRLTMYSDRRSFTEPLPITRAVRSASVLGSRVPAKAPVVPEAEEGNYQVLLWIGAIAVALFLFLRWWCKRKMAW